ncbi:DegT/DnrJ/EryC1/StrS family aminotransferase [Allocoprobacillus halotolerans]
MNTTEITKYLENECTIKNNQVIETKSGKRIKAIMPVHVFGNICYMEEIMKIAKKYNLYVIEDSTEALGSYYTNGPFCGKYAGTIGDVGVFSFNGNKIITTGGGGMVVSNNKKLIDKIRYLSTQAKDDTVYFIHNEIGFNYRLTNVQAALGLGQLEQLEQFIQIKKENYLLYKDLLKESNLGYILDFNSSIRPNYWFYTFMLKKPNAILRDQLIQYFKDNDVQTRPIWKLNHTQKPFLNYKMCGGKEAQFFYDSAINIPCSSNLTQEDVRRVAQLIMDFEKNYEKTGISRRWWSLQKRNRRFG